MVCACETLSGNAQARALTIHQHLWQICSCPRLGPRVAYCRRKTLAVGAVLLGVVGVASLRFNNQCINLGALQGKSEAGTQGQRVAV